MGNLDKAHDSLLGLRVGDAFGSHFEFEHVDWHRPRRAFESRELPDPIWRYTDDTQMASSIYTTLRQYSEIRSNKLAESFIQHFDISRGYGLGVEQMLIDCQAGEDWSMIASGMFDGQGSFGNGSSMRVAPVGAYFSDDFETVVENARRSSIVTHQHPDAIAGAIAVALAAAQTTRFRIEQVKPDGTQYWGTIIRYTPDGTLKDGLVKAVNLPPDVTTEKAARTLGCGWNVSAVDTVPFVLWCAITHLDNFEEALWQTISVGGDADTTGAIVGGIIGAYGGNEGIPDSWLKRCEQLPSWIFASEHEDQST